MYNSQCRPDRQSVRMKYYDYSEAGFYLVTACVAKRRCVFGEIRDDTMHLNNAGLIAQTMWERLTRHFSTVRLDAFIIMPNHMHGIIELITNETIPEKIGNNPRIPVRFQAHMQQEATKKANPTLGQIVRTFKGATTHDVRKVGRPDFAWQGGYYESVLRNDKALDHARNYILNNPMTWMKDTLHL
ncbi:MAG: hypothetical protein JO011_10820 [Ktedonobacteraceae bacterium]|nr:hypothetical protein [Ktedonobacteraceae bacterium]